MITLSYYRFVIDPNTAVHVFDGAVSLDKVRYHKVFDHNISRTDSVCDFVKASKAAKHWLKDHYGFVVIYQNNAEEASQMPRPIKICNHKKFFFDMLQNNLLVEAVL